MKKTVKIRIEADLNEDRKNSERKLLLLSYTILLKELVKVFKELGFEFPTLKDASNFFLSLTRDEKNIFVTDYYLRDKYIFSIRIVKTVIEDSSLEKRCGELTYEVYIDDNKTE